jgi:hypothetical protein
LKKRWRYSSVLLEMVRFWFYFYTGILKLEIRKRMVRVSSQSLGRGSVISLCGIGSDVTGPFLLFASHVE